MKTIVNCRELRLKCKVCNECAMWNANKACDECEKDNSSEMVTNSNNEEQEGNESCEGKSENATNHEERNRNKVGRIKVKGQVDEDKEDGVVRLFSANCNGLGPHAVSKIDQIMESSERRKIDGLMISSSDVRWTEYNKDK